MFHQEYFKTFFVFEIWKIDTGRDSSNEFFVQQKKFEEDIDSIFYFLELAAVNEKNILESMISISSSIEDSLVIVIAVLSAKGTVSRSIKFTSKSFTYGMNRRDPSTFPYGTPIFTPSKLLATLSTLTFCYLHVK